MVFYTVNLFFEYNNNDLLQRYDLLNQKITRNSIIAERLKFRAICDTDLDDEKAYRIQKEVSELLGYHNITFKMTFLSKDNYSINIENSEFSNIVDIIELLYEKGMELYKANVYWQPDVNTGYVMGNMIFNITGC